MKPDAATIRRAKPLLAFIKQPESLGDYDVVWGRIRPGNHPPKPLTTMTIAEVLAWQDSIDPFYRSEAAGAYQILEDTLRDIYRAAGMSKHDLFDKDGQDRLATALLIRRGYLRYLNGDLSTEDFANNLAMEWASLPMVSGSKKGRSYYGGDGLNKAGVTVEAFLDAVRNARDVKPAPPPQASWIAAILNALASIFRRST